MQKTHRWAGLLAALPILLLSVTGLLLVFEKELQTFEEREAALVQVPPGGVSARLPLSAILDRLAPALDGARVSYWVPPETANLAGLVRLTDDRYWFVNPYTAEVTKETMRPAPIMGAIRVLHTSFFLGDFGTWIGILASLAFCMLFGTGLFLFFKRRGTLTRRLRVSWKKGNAARNYDLHAVIGFWTGGLLALISLSGALIGIGQPWKDFILGVTNSTWADRPTIDPAEAEGAAMLPPERLLANLDPEVPTGMRATLMVLPSTPEKPFAVRYTYEWAQRPASWGFVHPYTGEVLEFQHFPHFDAGHLIHRLNRGFHSGEIFTEGMRWLWFILMAVPPLLIATGYRIWRPGR